MVQSETLSALSHFPSPTKSLATKCLLRMNGAAATGSLLGEEGLEGLEQPTHPQAIRELDAAVDGSGRQREEFAD